MTSVSLPTFDAPAAPRGGGINPAALPSQSDVAGIYVHIPFCFHKCHYCDFYSITRQSEVRMSHFVDLLLREADLWTCERRGPTPRPRTIFFGGGTPSLLPAHLMQRLIEGLRCRFDLSELAEWTVECNPATVTTAYLAMLRHSGIDRLSFGAQSFDRQELRALERHHDPQDVYAGIDAARAAGFVRLNLDLIYAVPGQSIESWDRSLRSAIALQTPHLSCYGLTYEPNTPMGVQKRLGRIEAIDESVELQMLRHTRATLGELGYEPYEISNYALPDEACEHNLLYWTGGSYIGLGPSAASHVEGNRWKNRPHLGEWESAIGVDQLPAVDIEVLTPRQRRGELAMLMLRLSQGIRFATYFERMGSDARNDFADRLSHLVGLGLLRIDADAIHLTERAIAVADAVAGEFL